MFYPTDRYDPAEVRELRHMANLGGWFFADYFSGNLKSIGDALLTVGHIEPGERDGRATYEVTEAGYTWLAGQES